MKIVSVVGARPQFIKAFPVSRALEGTHNELLVNTGQHYDHELSRIFLEELAIPEPAYNLGVGSAPPGIQTARIMQAFEPVLEREQPDAVIVYGDTNSTLGAALVTAKMDPYLVHVEAGLRSDNRTMPEELNRILTDHAADLLLAPTQRAMDRLKHEGIGERAINTGDVMFDALRWAKSRAKREHPVATSAVDTDEPYIVLTVHRAANTDDFDRLRTIVSSMAERTEPVVFPAHPRTIGAMRRAGVYERAADSLEMLEPMSYLAFVRLLDEASTVVTDSGGVQKEAFFLKTPCVTLRDETEWPETVDAGWNALVDIDADRIHSAIDNATVPRETAMAHPYGRGNAASKVVEALEVFVEGVEQPPTSI